MWLYSKSFCTKILYVFLVSPISVSFPTSLVKHIQVISYIVPRSEEPSLIIFSKQQQLDTQKFPGEVKLSTITFLLHHKCRTYCCILNPQQDIKIHCFCHNMNTLSLNTAVKGLQLQVTILETQHSDLSPETAI
jgi:hypothetical protein